MSNQLVKLTASTLFDRNLASEVMKHDMEVVSETAKQHLEQIKEEAEQIPMLVWVTYHLVNEMYAGAANLRAVRRECIRGKLAAQELGEMIESSDLMEINADDTKLISVHSPEEGTLEFVYREKYSVSLGSFELVAVGAAGLVLGMMTLMIFVNCEVVKALRGSRPSAMTRLYEHKDLVTSAGRLALALGLLW